jgi:hypothetical protein
MESQQKIHLLFDSRDGWCDWRLVIRNGCVAMETRSESSLLFNRENKK